VSGLIDYYNGLEDIENRKIRTLSEENMIADPLRMIRAYRFAAELKGSIEERTREIINLFHYKMKEVSSERITLEVFHLLNSEYSSKYLKMALHDKVLNDILFLPFKMLENNIRDIYKLEKGTIGELSYKFKVLLNKIFTQNLTYKGLLCLEILLRNKDLMLRETGNIRLSNRINRRIELAYKGIKEFKKGSTLMNKLFGIFMNSKEASVDLLIIKNRLDLFGKYDRFKKIWEDGYLSSEEIVRISNLATGPRWGEVIREVKKAQFEGKIKSKVQAANFVRRLQAV
jgi:tRNA nucleotidyltransferase/poly(A) polymerase